MNPLNSGGLCDAVITTPPNAPNSKLEGYDDNAARVQFLYQPDSTFSALFNLHGRDEKGTARLFRANIIQKGSNELVPGFVISVTREGTRFFAQATGQGKNEIFAEAPQRFFLKVVDAQMRFDTDANGDATALTLVQNGREMTGKWLK